MLDETIVFNVKSFDHNFSVGGPWFFHGLYLCNFAILIRPFTKIVLIVCSMEVGWIIIERRSWNMGFEAIF